MRGWVRVGMVALALAGRAGALRAQEIPPPALALVAGVAQYDLSGTGTEPFVGLRLDLPMAEFLYAEPGFGYMTYTSQGGEHVPHLSAEVQVQGTLPLGRWRPYVGVGAGGFFDLRKQRGGGELVEPTFSGSGGVRASVVSDLGAHAELRVRGVGKSFAGTIAEWSAGLAWAF
ncbi:MAG: hypothetical protein EXR95_03725 [Gemmatimonadetes bacterium]|nr:hypothetical protein [Gemmatimonadota bacterium]